LNSLEISEWSVTKDLRTTGSCLHQP